MFEKIDTKEKAYMFGFFMGDGHITKDKNRLELVVALSDSVVPKFFCEQFELSKYFERLKFDKKSRTFPKAGFVLNSKTECKNLIQLFGGRLCAERRVPILKSNLEPYFILGFFDAEGCITWGHRKDRDRLWQKVSFTSDLKILVGVQNILSKANISTIVRPKSKEKCFNIEFSNEMDVYRFYNYLPQDHFRLQRKQNNFKSWLDSTIKKYIINDGDVVNFIDVRSKKKYGLTYDIPYHYSKKFIVDKNGDINANSLVLMKKGISNFPLRLELVEISGSISKDVILREA